VNEDRLEPNRKDWRKVLLSGIVGDKDQSESKGDGSSGRADAPEYAGEG
jgi:hypothetical protein